VRLPVSIRRHSTWVVLLLLNSCACNPDAIESSETSLKPPLEPLPQDSQVQAYFNHSEASVYTEPYRQRTRLGDDLEQIIVDTIESASSTVDVAVQELRLPKIAEALVKQHRRGVRVRVIIENTYSRPWSEVSAAEIAKFTDRELAHYNEFLQLADVDGDGKLQRDEINQRDALVMLANGNVPLIDDTADGSKGSGLMHHKFVVADGKTVIVASANFTTSGIHGDFCCDESRGNANNLLKLESSKLADIFTREFEIMWGDGPGGKTDSLFGINKPIRGPEQMSVGGGTIAVQFAPLSETQPWENSVNGAIAQTLERADQTIDLALFVFSSQDLVNTLESAHTGGVGLRGLIDPSFAYRSYSEGLDMMGIKMGNNCKYEVGNNPWKHPIPTVGVPNLPEGDRLHHKFGVIDNKIVITGSHNWTEAANKTNDETMLIVRNPTVAAHFQREFERLYGQATLGIPPWILERVEAEKAKCDGAIATPFQPSGKPVNLNTASQEELETLPGVGPVLAERIIEAREKQPFINLEDADRVPGVGPKTLEKWRDRVTW